MLCNFQLESGGNCLFYWVLRLISLVLFISMQYAYLGFFIARFFVDYDQTPHIFADIDSKGVVLYYI